MLTLEPPGEYRVGAAPHVRQSWGDNSPMTRPPPPPASEPDPRVAVYEFGATSRWLSAGVGQVNDGRERNKRERRPPIGTGAWVLTYVISGAAYAGWVWQSRPEVGVAVDRGILPAPPRFPNSSVTRPRTVARGGGWGGQRKKNGA